MTRQIANVTLVNSFLGSAGSGYGLSDYAVLHKRLLLGSSLAGIRHVRVRTARESLHKYYSATRAHR